LWLCTNRIGGRHSVVNLDRRSFVNSHLLHHAVEEVFLLFAGPGGQDAVEVVDEGRE